MKDLAKRITAGIATGTLTGTIAFGNSGCVTYAQRTPGQETSEVYVVDPTPFIYTL